MKKEKKQTCPYCNQPTEWVENREIYGRNYGKSYMIWLCRKCDAYVGCHQNTKKPLGTIANKELRDWRMKAHSKIDPLWKSGKYHRGQIYAKLKKIFGYEIHIGESDIKLCKQIVNLAL